MNQTDLLTGLSIEELEALAESHLALVAQVRLDELLSRHTEQKLSTEERSELDRRLHQTDQLTLLKTRARYTLSQMKVEAIGS